MFKKILILSLFLSIFTGKIVLAKEIKVSSFKDISREHQSYETIKKLVEKYNILIGFPDGNFFGDKKLTRFEMAEIILKLIENLDKSQREKILMIEKIDRSNLKKLLDDYSEEIKYLTKKNEYIEDQLDLLEMNKNIDKQQFDDFLSKQPFLFTGSIAFRYQLITKKFGDWNDSTPQSRVSLGIKNRESGIIDYGIALVTGNPNKPVNTWWKLGDFFSRIGFNLDKFFITYNPQENLSFSIGKFSDPFSNSELLFDAEMNLQGANQVIKFKEINNWLKSFSLTTGEIIVNMDSSGENSFMLGGVAEIGLAPSEIIRVVLRNGYYHYLGEDNIALSQNIFGNSNSNSLEKSGGYQNGFRIFNSFAKVSFNFNDNFPLLLSGDYLHNFAALAENKAFQLSSRIGNSILPGNFFVGYNFKYLEKDAVIALFTEDQLGRTDTYAHEFFVGLKVFENTILSLTAQTQNKISQSEENSYTVRSNLIYNF